MQTGQKINNFTAPSSNGQIDFPKNNGLWTVLYIYEGDFLPTSATDIKELDRAYPKFSAHDAQIIAMSTDSVASHLAWILSLRNQNKDGLPIKIELISDRMGEIMSDFGVATQNESGTFIIDPEGILRAKNIHSSVTGINVTEIERELLALQTARYQFGQTPSGWTPGEDILDHPPRSLNSTLTNMSDKQALGGYCLDWYLCYRQDTGLRTQSPTAPPRE